VDDHRLLDHAVDLEHVENPVLSAYSPGPA
jgi:hypothetical protein